MILWLYFHIHIFFWCFLQLFYRKAGHSVKPHTFLKFSCNSLSCSSCDSVSHTSDTLIRSMNGENELKALRYHGDGCGMRNAVGRWADPMSVLVILITLTGEGFSHNVQAECQMFCTTLNIAPQIAPWLVWQVQTRDGRKHIVRVGRVQGLWCWI